MKPSLLALTAAVVLAAVVQAQTPKLTMQKFPDGSGEIGVAPGWKIDDGGAGAAILSGPGGAMMQLGQFRFVLAHNFDLLTITLVSAEAASRSAQGSAEVSGADPRRPKVN